MEVKATVVDFIDIVSRLGLIDRNYIIVKYLNLELLKKWGGEGGVTVDIRYTTYYI